MVIVSDCLPRELQIVGICALMVLSILNLCFQFAAICNWLNGFCTEQSCKQACIIVAILHISVLPFVWNCSSSGYIFFPFCEYGKLNRLLQTISHYWNSLKNRVFVRGSCIQIWKFNQLFHLDARRLPDCWPMLTRNCWFNILAINSTILETLQLN